MVSVEQEPARAALDTLRQRTSLLGVCPTQSTLSSPLVSQCVFFAISSLGRDILTFRHSGIIDTMGMIRLNSSSVFYIWIIITTLVLKVKLWKGGDFSYKLGDDELIFAISSFWQTKSCFCVLFVAFQIVMYGSSSEWWLHVVLLQVSEPTLWLFMESRVVQSTLSHSSTLYQFHMKVAKPHAWLDSILQPSCLNSTLELSHLPFSQSREPRWSSNCTTCRYELTNYDQDVSSKQAVIWLALFPDWLDDCKQYDHSHFLHVKHADTIQAQSLVSVQFHGLAEVLENDGGAYQLQQGHRWGLSISLHT